MDIETSAAIETLRTDIVQSRDDLRRHFDMIAESLKDDIRMIAEGLLALDRKVTGHAIRFTAIDTKLTAHDVRFTAIDASFTTIDTRFTAIDTKLAAIETKLAVHDGMLSTIDAKIDGLCPPLG